MAPSQGLTYAPDGWAYLSVETPQVFRESLLPVNTDECTTAESKELERLERLAERHGTHIHRSPYRRG